MLSRPARLLAGSLASLALAGGLLATSPSASAVPAGYTEDYYMTPGSYDWTVPAGVTSVEIEVNGAEGGTGENSGYPGGLGGRMIGEFTVTPGEVLKLHVGGRGADGGDGAEGGYNGGGDAPYATCISAGGGGGASDVRTSGNALSDRIIVAGGGGGGGYWYPTTAGGNGGGDTPTAGGSIYTFVLGGGAGSSSAGGAGGGGYSPYDGSPGALGVGGAGAIAGTCINGGGGGGGHYGGGGGATDPMDGGAGGGGGSAFIDSHANLTAAANGVQSGDGAIVLRYTIPPVTTTTTTTTPPPTPEPEAPKPECPKPVPGLRVYPNAFSVQVAAHLIDNCGSTAREVQVFSEKLVVLDPPSNGMCPTWRAVRVVAERNSVLIAGHLINNCRYTVKLQRDSRTSASVWVVPSGWPEGARAFG